MERQLAAGDATEITTTQERLYKETGSEQSLMIERELDLLEHLEAMNEEAEPLELEHKAPEVVWAPILEQLQLKHYQ